MITFKEDLINIKELSSIFGLKISYIYKLIHQRKINYYKPFGKKVFFKLSEMQILFDGSKIEAVASDKQLKDKADIFMMK